MKRIISLILISISSLVLSQQDLKSTLEHIIKDKKATVGVSVWHLENGDTLSINGNKHLPMQSVFKLHIAMAVLDQVDQGKLNINNRINVKKSELLPDTWSPLREKYPNGNSKIPLTELINFTVSKSDNNGCDILLRLIGGVKTVQAYTDKIGIKDFRIVAGEEEMHKDANIQYQNFSTSNSANNVLEKLYTKPVLKQRSKDFLIKILEETTTGNKRLKGLLPENIIVAHKTGTSGTDKTGKTAATNDIGVITLPNGQHLVISVFVSDSYEDEKTNEKIIADIAKTSYEFYK